MRRFSFLALVLVMACGTGGGSARPASVAQPEVRAELAHDVFFGSGTTAPATIDVTVLNRANVPIMLRRVEVSSPGMAQYGIYTTFRDFRETIQPGETKSVPVFATAVTTVRNPNEPLTIRAIADFEAAGKVWREVVMSR